MAVFLIDIPRVATLAAIDYAKADFASGLTFSADRCIAHCAEVQTARGVKAKDYGAFWASFFPAYLNVLRGLHRG